MNYWPFVSLISSQYYAGGMFREVCERVDRPRAYCRPGYWPRGGRFRSGQGLVTRPASASLSITSRVRCRVSKTGWPCWFRVQPTGTDGGLIGLSGKFGSEWVEVASEDLSRVGYWIGSFREA